MLRYLIFFVFIYLIVRGLRSFLPDQRGSNATGKNDGEDMVKDPNCNIYIPLESAIVAKVNGRHYYFCSRECLNSFKSKAL